MPTKTGESFRGDVTWKFQGGCPFKMALVAQVVIILILSPYFWHVVSMPYAELDN